jgi:hypothetical protein
MVSVYYIDLTAAMESKLVKCRRYFAYIVTLRLPEVIVRQIFEQLGFLREGSGRIHPVERKSIFAETYSGINFPSPWQWDFYDLNLDCRKCVYGEEDQYCSCWFVRETRERLEL